MLQTKKILKKTADFLKSNKWCFIQMAVLLVPHAVGYATVGANVSTGMPWDTGINTIQSALTGPIPKAGAGIAIATAGGLWMFGESQITKVAMRTALGSGIALSAPTAVTALAGAGSGSGCLFF
jgi:type IV secretion system protein VirB2